LNGIGFKPGRSAGWRTWARRSGSRGTRTHERPEAATCFQDRPLIRPDGFREGLRPEFRGLDSNQRPPRSERGVTTVSNCPGVREGGFEPPPPDSKSGSLPVSRFPRAPRGSRTRLSDLGSPRLTARPGTHQRSLRVRDRGVEPRSPGWKPGVVPLDQSRSLRAEGEGVEPSRLIARPDSSRVPSPFGLPFLNRAAPAAGIEPASPRLTAGCSCQHELHRNRKFRQSGWPDSNRRSPAPKAGGLARLSYIPSRRLPTSAQRESNPHVRHGKAVGCRYIMGTFAVPGLSKIKSTGWDSNPRHRLTSAGSSPLDD
jgi:hypothetical protein